MTAVPLWRTSCPQVAFWRSTREAFRRLKTQRLVPPKNEQKRSFSCSRRLLIRRRQHAG